MLDWIRLLRLSGVFTVAGNTLAVVASSALEVDDLGAQILRNGLDVLWVICASTLLYCSGMLWNDLADAERDRTLNPRRPLAAGRISYTAAWFVGALLSSLALLCAAQLGFRGLYAASIVLLLALSYNLVTKSIPWLGSVTMALVRLSHAVFALLILGADHFDRIVLTLLSFVGMAELGPGVEWPVYPLLIGVYIFALTLISELESRHGYRWELILGGIIMLGCVLFAGYLAFTSDQMQQFALESSYHFVLLLATFAAVVGGLLFYRIAKPWLAALRSGKKNMVPRVVISGLGGMLLFDALIAIGYQPIIAIVILILIPPFLVLGRLARMD